MVAKNRTLLLPDQQRRERRRIGIYDDEIVPPATGGTGAPTDASYVVMGANAVLAAERVLTAGSGIGIVDGGPNGPVTISAFGLATQSPGWYGSGADGAVVFDGINTYAFASLAGSTYTLNRDLHATSIVVSAGIALVTGSVASGSWRVHCINNFQNDGSVGAPGTNGGNGAAGGGTGGAALTAGTLPGSLVGANGATGNGTNQGVSAAACVTNAGQGSAGHGTSTNIGGTSTAPTPPTNNQGNVNGVYNIFNCYHALCHNAAIFTQYSGAQGGATGGGGGVGVGSGGAGSGGGWCLIAARTISGAGTFTVKGGAAGIGTVSNTWGGSNGGSSGVLIVITGSVNYKATITCDISGGDPSQAGGAPLTTAGSVGGVGRLIEFFYA